MQITHHNNTDEISCTLPQSAADGKSEIVDLGTARLYAIQMPAAWTAAKLSFLASADGVSFGDLYNTATEYTVDVDAGRLLIPDLDFFAIQYLQLRSGVAATPVQQAADRTVKLICFSRL